ncbi:MAG: PIN domain-containing protein [Rhodocyclaceae bacterium]|nr:PIN domain-containing protein [Rhodocyclaceae bacterium]
MIFLDTNILLYAVSTSPDEAGKQCLAEHLVFDTDWSWSAQVMQEFYSNVIKPTSRRTALTSVQAYEFLESLLPDHPCQSMDAELILQALHFHQHFRIQWWDAPILAAAHRMNCSQILSEDFQQGRNYDGVTVVNPFLETVH